jgi:hypothetical protein
MAVPADFGRTFVECGKKGRCRGNKKAFFLAFGHSFRMV